MPTPTQGARATRRDLLLGAGSALALGRSAGSLAAPRAQVAFTELGDALTLVQGAGANVVVLHSARGLLLVDGGSPAAAGALHAALQSRWRGQRVHTLFNTHWHPEQTGSNERLARSGARIIGHENTRLWLGTDAPLPPDTGRTYGPLPAAARPERGLYGTESLPVEGETVEYGLVPQAHTNGDLYVYFRRANVLVAGGVLASDRWPLIDYRTGGWLGGLANGVAQLATLGDAGTRVVPADGPVMDHDALRAQRDQYAQLHERFITLLTSGLEPAEVVARAPTAGLHPEWGDPTTFVLQAFKSLWPHHAPDA